MNIKKIANTTLKFIIHRLIEIIGVSIALVGILLLTSLISYSPNDPNFIFPENTEIQNILGFHGSYISDLFFQSVGVISYLLLSRWAGYPRFARLQIHLDCPRGPAAAFRIAEAHCRPFLLLTSHCLPACFGSGSLLSRLHHPA